MKIEIGRFRDGRLKVKWIFELGTNFWKHDDGSFSYVPTEEDICQILETYKAINEYNLKKL